MASYLFYVTGLVFVVVLVLILRKTEPGKIDAMGRFFKSLNPFSIFKKQR
jgi:hypothetical protein